MCGRRRLRSRLVVGPCPSLTRSRRRGIRAEERPRRQCAEREELRRKRPLSLPNPSGRRAVGGAAEQQRAGALACRLCVGRCGAWPRMRTSRAGSRAHVAALCRGQCVRVRACVRVRSGFRPPAPSSASTHSGCAGSDRMIRKTCTPPHCLGPLRTRTRPWPARHHLLVRSTTPPRAACGWTRGRTGTAVRARRGNRRGLSRCVWARLSRVCVRACVRPRTLALSIANETRASTTPVCTSSHPASSSAPHLRCTCTPHGAAVHCARA